MASEIFNTDNPLLKSILRQLHELDAPVPPELLQGLFDAAVDSEALEWAVRAAARQVHSAYAPVLERAAGHRSPAIQRLGLQGLVKLQFPFDPLRTASELLTTPRRKSLSAAAKIVGYGNTYLKAVSEAGLSDFCETASPGALRNTHRALGKLKARKHLARLNTIQDELGDDPRRVLKAMRRREREALEKRLFPPAEKLNLPSLEIALYRYVLAHPKAFAELEAT